MGANDLHVIYLMKEIPDDEWHPPLETDLYEFTMIKTVAAPVTTRLPRVYNGSMLWDLHKTLCAEAFVWLVGRSETTLHSARGEVKSFKTKWGQNLPVMRGASLWFADDYGDEGYVWCLSPTVIYCRTSRNAQHLEYLTLVNVPEKRVKVRGSCIMRFHRFMDYMRELRACIADAIVMGAAAYEVHDNTLAILPLIAPPLQGSKRLSSQPAADARNEF